MKQINLSDCKTLTAHRCKSFLSKRRHVVIAKMIIAGIRLLHTPYMNLESIWVLPFTKLKSICKKYHFVCKLMKRFRF